MSCEPSKEDGKVREVVPVVVLAKRCVRRLVSRPTIGYCYVYPVGMDSLTKSSDLFPKQRDGDRSVTLPQSGQRCFGC